LAQLLSFPFIKESEEQGLLALHGLHFDLASGTLLSLEQETGRFVALSEV
jgi:carbonic anhydrase